MVKVESRTAASSPNNRVLIWNALPTTNQAPADLVLGQPDAAHFQPNAGGAVGPAGLDRPSCVHATGSRVTVADSGNHRVLVWTAPVTRNGQAADLVLGQPGFTGNTANAGGLSGASLYGPSGVAGDGTRLAVSDRFNNRVLFYPAIPAANGAPASTVLGQPHLAGGRPDDGGPVSGSSMVRPGMMALLGPRFALADPGDHRVLIWDAPPTSADERPRLVLGQADFTSFVSPEDDVASASSLCGPSSLASDGVRLLVGERCASRVTIWSALPTATHQPADLAIGVPDLTTSHIVVPPASASALGIGPQPYSDGQRLFVADRSHHRVLIWNALPTSSGQAADRVLGQPDMTSSRCNEGGVSAASLCEPEFVLASGGKLLVADSANNRVLIWNTLPTNNRTAADVVLGQPDTASAASAPPSARSLGWPNAMAVDGQGRLYVVDLDNHRVLYWNTIPAENQAPADGVIGQPTVETGLANDGGLGARTLQYPGAILATDSAVYVADTGNNRVLVLPRP
jgi:hypothetical protein